MSWVTMLLGDRHETLRSNPRDFKEVSILKDMYVFVYKHIRSAEDTDRVGKGVSKHDVAIFRKICKIES